jgi:hypothetical protein
LTENTPGMLINIRDVILNMINAKNHSFAMLKNQKPFSN